MRLPQSIYEAIPAIYVAAAFTCMLFIEEPFSLIPAFLLIVASWMVWRARKDHRNRQRVQQLRTNNERSS